MNGLIARSRDSVVESPGHLSEKIVEMDFNSFTHGQVVSKLWLCEVLEPYLSSDSTVFILGGWHNVLGFMMSVRKPNYYSTIINVDIDTDAIEVAKKVCDAFPHRVINVAGDSNKHEITPGCFVINCSVEHFESDEWYTKLDSGTMVCVQSSDVTDPTEPWLIKNPNPDLETFLKRFPVTEQLFVGTHRIQYDHFGYNRFMLIGRK